MSPNRALQRMRKDRAAELRRSTNTGCRNARALASRFALVFLILDRGNAGRDDVSEGAHT